MSKALSLKARAIALLAQREHSVNELRRKLLRIAREIALAAAQEAALAGGAAGDVLRPRGRGRRSIKGEAGDDGCCSDGGPAWLVAAGATADAQPRRSAEDRGSRTEARSQPHGEVAIGLIAPITLDAERLSALAEDVEQLLQQLQASGYLSESRFVEARINSRAQRFGNRRIQQELAQHGLSLDAEQQAQLKDSEIDRARSIWQRKFGGEAPADLAARAKQTRFLAARGFSAEVIRRLLREAGD